MKFTHTKIVGTPTKASWAQIYSFLPQDEEKQGTRGELIAAFSLEGASEGMEAVSLGRELLARLHEEYFGNEEGGCFERLKTSVEKVGEEFSGQAQVEIAASVHLGGFVYFALWGQAKVLLWRAGKLSVLLAGKTEKVVFLSGEPKADDVFLLGTSSFFQTIKIPALTAALQKQGTLADLADNLIPIVHQEERPSLAAAVLRVHEGEIEQTPELPAKRPAQEVRRRLGSLRLKIPSFLPRLSIKTPSQRTASSVGVILLVLLLVSIGLGLRQGRIRDYQATYMDRLVRAETVLARAVLQKDVDSQVARDSFLEASALVEKLTDEGVKDKRLEELKAKLAAERPSVLGEVKIEPQTLLDLSLVRSGIKAAEIVLDEGTLAVLDKEGKRIISLSETGKDNSVIGGPEKLGEAQDLALYVDRNFVFGSRGVVEIGKRGDEKVLVQPDEGWGEVTEIGAFGGNLYLLDKQDPSTGSGQIWRYPGIEDGFGSRQSWLGQGVEPDFSLVVDMAIDGSIWVLSSSGKILKFTRGAPEAVNIQGLDRDFSQPRAIYTDENLESFYILDSANSRIVEVSKDKQYQKQYLWDEMADVRDIAVSKDAGKIFLLTETKILEIPLK